MNIGYKYKKLNIYVHILHTLLNRFVATAIKKFNKKYLIFLLKFYQAKIN